MNSVWALGIRCALAALLGLWFGSASAADEITERAVPAPPQLRVTPAMPGAARSASGGTALGGATGAQVSVEQQMGLLQQRIMALESQIAMLQSVLIVTPTGTTLQAPTLLLQSLNGTIIESQKNVSLRVGQHLSVDTAENLSMRTGAATTFQSGGTLDVKGSSIRLNGGTKPLATLGSQVQIVPGQSIGQVITGSPTILGN